MVDKNVSRIHHLNAIAFAVWFPTVVTLVYFEILKSYPAGWQQTAYLIGKTIQFGFPVIWIWWFLPSDLTIGKPKPNGIAVGIAFGCLVAVAMVALYLMWLRHLDQFSGFQTNIQEKIDGMGLDSVWKFAGLGLFYGLCHSFLEEYYWRWFVFRQLKKIVSLKWAIAISSLGFMAHHVVLLAHYFGWTEPLTYLFSLSVAVGGAFWAWMYHRFNSLISPWISHMVVDIAIFAIGLPYRLLIRQVKTQKTSTLFSIKFTANA